MLHTSLFRCVHYKLSWMLSLVWKWYSSQHGTFLTIQQSFTLQNDTFWIICFLYIFLFEYCQSLFHLQPWLCFFKHALFSPFFGSKPSELTLIFVVIHICFLSEDIVAHSLFTVDEGTVVRQEASIQHCTFLPFLSPFLTIHTSEFAQCPCPRTEATSEGETSAEKACLSLCCPVSHAHSHRLIQHNTDITL